MTVPTAAACSRRFVLKSVRPRRGLLSPPTPAFGSHCPSFPHRAHVAPSHGSCEWHSGLPTAWILHILAAGGLVPSIYFYIYVLSLRVTVPSPGREGRVCGKVHAPPFADWLVLRVGSIRTVAAFAPFSFFQEALLEREQGIFESGTQCLIPAPSVTSCATLDKLPNLSEPHIPHGTKMRIIPTSQGWCEDEVECCR